MVVGKLKNSGELLVSGIDTRSPLITDGLVAYYPMDGTSKGIHNSNILDYSTWIIGTSGSQVGFSQNGDGNSIVEDIGPFGESQAIWQSLGNDAASDADGGWNGSNFTIDKTKKYRHSVWIRRKVTGNGTGYFGCLGNQVYNIAANTVNSNPYFWASTFPNNDWLLFVSYVYPHDIGNIVPSDDAGIYNISKTKIAGIATFKFSPTATANNHRTYLYYSTLATTNQQWAYPRVDLCDGTEPSLDDLLSGEGNVINPSSISNVTITNDGVAVEEGTTNVIPFGDFSAGLQQPYASAYAGVVSIIDDLELGRKVLKYRNTSTTGESYTNSWTTPLAVALNGQTWTSSIYVKAAEINTSVELFVMGLNSSNNYVDIISSTKIISPSDGWVQLVTTKTFTNSTVAKITVRLDINSAGKTIYARDWQLEQKPFATEYVNGSRSAQGMLQLYKPSLVNECTINFDYYCTESISNTIISNANYKTKWWGLYINSSGYLYTHEGSGGAVHTSTYLVEKFKWINITIAFNQTTQYYYVDGVLKGSLATNGTTTVANINTIYLGMGWNVGNAKFKNVAVYNRLLENEEIIKLIKGTHKFTKEKLITKSINTTGEIRYIRDYINGSTANTGNQWVEIKANTQDGTNVALGKTPTSSVSLSNIAYITDGIVSSSYAGGDGGLAYVQIDLGGMYLIDNIQVWHYYIDGRTYYNTRTQVSHDGIKWYDVFNSDTDGTYQETVNGITHYVGGSGESVMKAKETGLIVNGIDTTTAL